LSPRPGGADRDVGPFAATTTMSNLVFVDPSEPGISRVRTETGFRYLDQRNRPIERPAVLRRIEGLVIPPAWENVWICAKPNGHLQAVGTDQRGRRQYRYHPEFRTERDNAKFRRILSFARALPTIRQRVEQDMSQRGLGRDKVVATLVHLLETTMIRVGNDRYAKDNKTFGLSTLRSRHAAIEGSTLRFSFKGKSGKPWSISIRDRRAARIVKACQELPGQTLFQYLDEDGERRRVTSNDVNAYLKRITGKPITAKDFRTWGGTVLCAVALGGQECASSKAAMKRQIAAAVREVAGRLGNTPAICRTCYIHPQVLSAFSEGDLMRRMRKVLIAEAESHELRPEENAVLSLIRQRLRALRKAERQDEGQTEGHGRVKAANAGDGPSPRGGALSNKSARSYAQAA